MMIRKTRTDRSFVRSSLLLVAAFAVALLPACQASTESASTESAPAPAAEPEPAPPPARAEATLSPTEGNTASGTVTFTETSEGVRVSASLTGVPEGVHGIHVHENGDCSAPDGTSAGGHFDPAGTPHGAQVSPSSARHAGDLGNLVADADGNASYEGLDLVLSFDEATSLVGRAVVLHGGRDDLTSQPSGAAGPRIACGVIEAR